MCENLNASCKAAGSSNHVATGKTSMEKLHGYVGWDSLWCNHESSESANKGALHTDYWEIIIWLLVQGGSVPVINMEVSVYKLKKSCM